MANSERFRAAIAALILALLALSPVEAQQNDADARLRAALREVTAQLRTLQDQNAELMAKQAQTERDRMTMSEKLAADERELATLRQQVQTSRTAAEQSTAQVEAQKAELMKTGDAYMENIAKWQAAYNQAAEVARGRDGDAKRFEAANAQLRGQVRACEDKNAQLFKLGNEVLDMRDKQSFFDRVTSAEPVTQLKRVQLENLMQDYQQKMLDNQVTTPPTAPVPAPASVQAPASEPMPTP